MRPGPTEVHPESSSPPTQENTFYAQHGFDIQDEQASSRFYNGRRSDGPQFQTTEGDSPSSPGPRSVQGLETPLRGLSPETPPTTRSSVDRIAKYEKALVSRTKYDGPRFEVVQSKKPPTGDSVIATFPNGTLLQPY